MLEGIFWLVLAILFYYAWFRDLVGPAGGAEEADAAAVSMAYSLFGFILMLTIVFVIRDPFGGIRRGIDIMNMSSFRFLVVSWLLSFALMTGLLLDIEAEEWVVWVLVVMLIASFFVFSRPFSEHPLLETRRAWLSVFLISPLAVAFSVGLYVLGALYPNPFYSFMYWSYWLQLAVISVLILIVAWGILTRAREHDKGAREHDKVLSFGEWVALFMFSEGSIMRGEWRDMRIPELKYPYGPGAEPIGGWDLLRGIQIIRSARILESARDGDLGALAHAVSMSSWKNTRPGLVWLMLTRFVAPFSLVILVGPYLVVLAFEQWFRARFCIAINEEELQRMTDHYLNLEGRGMPKALEIAIDKRSPRLLRPFYRGYLDAREEEAIPEGPRVSIKQIIAEMMGESWVPDEGHEDVAAPHPESLPETDTANWSDVNWNTFPCMVTVSGSSVPSTVMGKVREFIIEDNEETRDIIRKIPKAELHAHIGGILSIANQKRVGQAIWDDMSEEERAAATESVRPLLDLAKGANPQRTVWPYGWSSKYLPRDGEIARANLAAALLTALTEEQLNWVLFPSFEDCWEGRVSMTVDHGFEAYPIPGELMGSTVLSSPSKTALRRYCEGITDFCSSDAIRYIEIRMSPTKYRETIEGQVRFVQMFCKFLNASMSVQKYDYKYGVIISGDRRHFGGDDGEERFSEFKKLLEKLDGELVSRDRVVGFDIAGAEEESDIPEFVREGCKNIQRENSLQFTLHAGEQSSVQNLRQALDMEPMRIGHGLKFEDDDHLMEWFSHRSTAIEMCPTSNIEVIGFQGLPEIRGMHAEYPLRSYLQHGLKIVLCSDNPFISRTDLTQEFVRASLMSEPRLRLDEAITIIFNSFNTAFCKRNLRKKMQEEIDEELRGILMEHFTDG